MTAFVVSPSIAAVYTALGNFLTTILGLSAGQVIQGYQNRVAMPSPPGAGFVLMNAVGMKRLRTNVDLTPAGNAPTTQTYEQGTEIDVQLDVYGPAAADWANIITTLFRDNYGCLALAPNCAPLYTDDPIRAPLTNAEEQYEDRWIVTVKLQFNPITTTPQQYADVLGPVNIVDVEAAYGP